MEELNRQMEEALGELARGVFGGLLGGPMRQMFEELRRAGPGPQVPSCTGGRNEGRAGTAEGRGGSFLQFQRNPRPRTRRGWDRVAGARGEEGRVK
jgi:hypothetical protein